MNQMHHGPTFLWHGFLGRGGHGRVRSHMQEKKIRFNLLKISSKFAGHEMMKCHIYSPTNIAYMSRWMAKIQFKPNKEENKIAKKKDPSKVRTSKARESRLLHSSGVHMHSRIAHQIWNSDLNWSLTQVGPKRGSCMR